MILHGYVRYADNSGMAIDRKQVKEPPHMQAGLTILRIEICDELTTWCKVVINQSGRMPDFITASFVDLDNNIGSGTQDSSILKYLGGALKCCYGGVYAARTQPHNSKNTGN